MEGTQRTRMAAQAPDPSRQQGSTEGGGIPPRSRRGAQHPRRARGLFPQRAAKGGAMGFSFALQAPHLSTSDSTPLWQDTHVTIYYGTGPAAEQAERKRRPWIWSGANGVRTQGRGSRRRCGTVRKRST